MGGGPLNTETVSLRSSLLPSTSVTAEPRRRSACSANLVGGAVINAQGARTPPYIDAQGLPREGLLEDALPEVAGEKESVWPTCPQGGKEPDMGDADILRFVHDREVKDCVLALRDRGCQCAEHLRMSDQLARFQPGTNALEDRPQHHALCLLEPSLSAETRDIAILLPVLQLPGINHLLPFGEEKMQAELMSANGTRGLLQQLADNLAAGDRRRPTWDL